jgi:farnesyl-diphosphate farnesyltransferase
VVGKLADKAETHLLYGLRYILSFPRRQHGIRLACMWPLLFAVKTLAVSRNNIRVVLSEVKITRSDVMNIVRSTTLFGWSNNWLVNYYYRLQDIRPAAVVATPAVSGITD